MTQALKHSPLKLILASASLLSLTACATALQKRAPEDIAAKAYRTIDSYTGLEQTRIPAIQPFKWGANVRGTARLQSAEAFQGQNGGAWLDVTLRYDTPTPEPLEMRVYNKARWPGGELVQIADFSAAILSCEDRVTEYSSNGGYGGGHFGGGYYGDGYGHGRRGRHGSTRRDDRHGHDNQRHDNQGERSQDDNSDDDRDPVAVPQTEPRPPYRRGMLTDATPENRGRKDVRRRQPGDVRRQLPKNTCVPASYITARYAAYAV